MGDPDYCYSGKVRYGNKRPCVDEMLQTIRSLKTWEIIVFTAGVQGYAEGACQAVFYNSRCAYRILSRHHCKNLSTLCSSLTKLQKEVRGFRDPRTCIIVDNSPKVMCIEEAHNLVPIKTWTDSGCDQEDTELLKIGHLIIELDRLGGDVRIHLRRWLHVWEKAMQCIRSIPGGTLQELSDTQSSRNPKENNSLSLVCRDIPKYMRRCKRVMKAKRGNRGYRCLTG